MKTLLISLNLLAMAHVLSAQQKTSVIQFGRDGRITNSRLASVYMSTVNFDLSRINVPGSAFVPTIRQACYIPLPVLADTILMRFYTIPDKSFPDFVAQLSNRSVLAYDSTMPYSPFKLVSERTGVRISADSLQNSDNSPSMVLLSAGEGKPTSYEIWKEDFDNQIISSHLAASRRYYKGITLSSTILLDSLKDVFGKYFPSINRSLYNDSIANCQPSIEPVDFHYEVVSELVSIDPGIQLLNRIFCKTIDENREWISRWLWLTGGEIKLNPFPAYNTDALIAQAEMEIASSEKALAMLSDYSQCCKFGQMEYNTATKKADSLLTRTTVLNKERLRLMNLSEVYRKWVESISIGRHFLYKGFLAGSTTSHIAWNHHFDASDKFRFMTTPDDLPELVAPQDEVIALVHNVKSSDSLSLKSTEEAFRPKTKLEIGLEPFSAALKMAFKMSTGLGGITSLIAGVVPGKPSDNNKAGQLLASQIQASLDNKIKDLEKTEKKIEVKKEKKETELQKPETLSVAQKQKKTDELQELNKSLEEVRREIERYSIDAEAKLRSLTTSNRKEVINSIIQLLSDPKLIDSLRKLRDESKANFVKDVFDQFGQKDVVAYTELIEEYQLSKIRIQWFFDQTSPILLSKLDDEIEPDFRTVAEYPEAKLEITSSKKVKYEIFKNENKEPEITRNYPKYELARWWPTVGIAYVPAARSGSVFNDSTGTFMSDSDFDNFEILAGVKFYPWKTNPVRDNATRRLIRTKFNTKANRLRGNGHFSNTAFLTGGFGVRHKFLRNYYLGAGLDITPGLSLLAGFNYIFHKRYALEDGHIKSQVERPNGFVFFGLSLDPNIINNLADIFK